VRSGRGPRNPRSPLATHDADADSARALRVLVVDDEDVLCRALTQMLTRAGYAVETARTGAAAEDALATRTVDFLVLDYRMPDTRGDLLYAIALARQPHLRGRAIFLTGDITHEAEATIAETGCQLVRKPFDNNDLLDAIARIV
jgi:two-component system NtrC family sensor kinase